MPEEMAAAGTESSSLESSEPIESTSSEGFEQGTETEGSAEGSEQQPVERTSGKTRATLDSISAAKRDALKAIDPSLPGLIKDSIMAQKTMTREFPGGLREAIGIRDAYEAAGGEIGIRETQEAIADYSRLEQMFESGDKGFIESLAEASPESFSAMMTPGLEAWRQKDPEMYTHAMSRVMFNTLGSNVISVLRKAYEALPADKKSEELADLHDRLLGLNQAAQNAPQRKVDPNKQELTRREQELAQREVQANLSPVRSDGLRQIQTVTDAEMGRSYQWNDTDPDVQEAVRNEVRSRLIKLSGKDKAFTDKYNNLVQQKDWNGLKRHINRYQAVKLPAIVQQAARLFNVKAKTAAKNGVKPANTGTKTVVEQGWVRVSGPPQAKDIDRSKTDMDMVYDGKAILKSGKKVQWG